VESLEDEGDENTKQKLRRLRGDVDLILAWQKVVGPSVARLKRDQDFRDYRREKFDKAWKRWGTRVAVVAGLVGIVSGLVELGVRIAQGISML
jgi:hypothetical protein